MVTDLRYQHQPWPVRLWRRRWYLTIPWTAFRGWIRERGTDRPLTFAESWSFAIGMAQVRMGWIYTWEEREERCKTKER